MSAEQWVTVTGNAVVLVAAVLGFLSTRRKVEQVHEVAAKTAKLVESKVVPPPGKPPAN